ncbi:MAG: GAF domain-containing protein [Labilithrix sp.]|nr:GAF domain-containing protein [Labilithrix sp.]
MGEGEGGTSATLDRVALHSDVLGAFADATADYPRLLETIAARTAAVLGHFCALCLLSPDGLHLETVATCDPREGEGRSLAALAEEPLALAASPVLREALAAGESVLFAEPSAGELTRTLDEPLRSAARALDVGSVLVAPLRARQETYGVLLVVCRGALPPLAAEGRALADDLARHAALAIANARLLRALRLEIAERESRRIAELEVANRELESFSYSVSHDLRAPVRAIAGFALLLEEEHAKGLDAEGLRLLGVIRRSAQRMGMLTDDLLALSRTGRQAMKIEAVDMDALAREALDEARRAEPDREYDVRIAPLPPAAADRSLLEHVWRNLLANAVKYSRGRSPTVIEIGGETTDDETVYRVNDNGVGFDMRYADRLFKVFERLHTEPEFEGTGVGLALVDRIVRRHGGRVWAEGALGAGATFHFALPRAARAG